MDVTRLLPGPYGVMLLADLGADVIKVEQPGYESNVMPRRPPVDRHKRSIALDLKKDEARAIFYKLAERSDVVVEQFRPGVTRRLGIDYETLAKFNPRLIYCSVTGYGQEGPYRDLPGHDPNYQAVAGIIGLTGTPDGQPVLPGIPIADLAGGLHLALAIATALWAREKSGAGQWIDLSISDALVSWLGVTWGGFWFLTGRALRLGERPSHIYKTKDERFICLAPIEPHFWTKLCRVLGTEEYIPYHREVLIFRTPLEEKRQEIVGRFAQIFRTKTRGEWLELLRKEDIPVAPVYEIEEVFQDPHFISRGMIQEVKDPALGNVKQVSYPVKFSQGPVKVRSLAPLRGEHTIEILRELGYGESEIDQFRKREVIG